MTLVQPLLPSVVHISLYQISKICPEYKSYISNAIVWKMASSSLLINRLGPSDYLGLNFKTLSIGEKTSNPQYYSTVLCK